MAESKKTSASKKASLFSGDELFGDDADNQGAGGGQDLFPTSKTHKPDATSSKHKAKDKPEKKVARWGGIINTSICM